MRVYLTKHDLNKDKESVQPSLYDYGTYHMRFVDKLTAFVIGFAAAAVVLHIFFANPIVDVIAGAVTGMIAQPIYRRFMINRNIQKLTVQFKDMLDSLNSSVSAGNVMQRAFADAQADMEFQYGADSFIVKELKVINNGIINGKIIEDLVMDFGQRSHLDDITNFANVFGIAQRRGGNMKSIITETKSIICDKIDIEQEIHSVVNGTKNELNIMMIMPLLIVPLMSSFSQEGDNQVINIAVKLFGIVVFVIAYIIGRKIVNIKM